ncbi:MAG: transketolase C-terminal domain-containing protein [Nocardioides sp.]
MLGLVKKRVNAVPGVGHAAYDALHAIKKGVKDALAPQGLFEDLGFKYVGPVDGHDVTAMEQALQQAKRFGGPVIVHAITRKGYGYDAAEQHEADQFHAPRPLRHRHRRGEPQGAGSGPTSSPTRWSHLGAAATRSGRDHSRDDPSGGPGQVPAAVPRPLLRCRHRRAARRPRRRQVWRWVVCIPWWRVYATFLNRAFDQVLMDVALHKCGVTFVLDRAGVTGDDGASHNGMWDMSVFQVVPGLRIAAPRDPARLRRTPGTKRSRSPMPRRWSGSPRAPRPRIIAAVGKAGGCDLLVRSGRKDVLIVAVGAMATTCVDVAERLTAQGIGVTVVDPRWVKPVDPALVELAREHRLVVSVEDNGRIGGVGAVLLQTLTDAGVTTPFRLHGVPQEFLLHAKRASILEQVGLTPQALARGIVEDMAAVTDGRDAAVPEGAARP